MFSIDNNAVTFTANNYRKGGHRSIVQLSDHEFIRRFSLHILPKGFVRIRHFGILSSILKKTKLLPLKEAIGIVILPEKAPLKINTCPACKKGQLVTVFTFDKRGPPQYWVERIEKQESAHEKQTEISLYGKGMS